MPRFQMILSSQDYYSNEGSWSLILPKEITTREQANSWVKEHLKQILSPTAGAGHWVSITHFRYDRGHCEGNASYMVDIVEIDGDISWEEFVKEWNEAHPNNRPADWSGLW